MTKCSRCFRVVPTDRVSFAEVEPKAQEKADATASAYLGHDDFMGEIKSYHVAGGVDLGGIRDQAMHELGGDVYEICPICHYRWPLGWRAGNVTCVAMAGARATGKSVYVAVVIKQLARTLERLGFELGDPSPQTAAHYREHYEAPFYEQRGLLTSTASGSANRDSYQHHPLIFSLGLWNGTRQFLAIRDVAGEDLSTGKLGGLPGSFFAAADAVFFLFDPFQVQEIRDTLRDEVAFDENRGGDPRSALATVLRLIADGNPQVAVIVSKFDALHAVGQVAQTPWAQIMSNPGAAYCRDPGLLGKRFDPDDSDMLHCEVQSLLQKLEAPVALRSMVNPDTGKRYQHRYFAVSALGDSPMNTSFDPMGFAPFRCLDPLRWVLAQRGIL